MSQKFQMDKYYDDLENLQEKLSRFKSEKGPSNIRKQSSHKNLFRQQDTTQPRAFGATRQLLVMDKPTRVYSKQGSLYEKEDSVKARAVSKYDRSNLMLTETTDNLKKTANSVQTTSESEDMVKLKMEREALQKKLSEVSKQNSKLKNSLEKVKEQEVVAVQPVQGGKQEQQGYEEEVFIRETNLLYNITQTKTSVSPLDQLISELRKRDGIYKVVEEKFEGQNPSNFKKLLQNMFEREKLLTRIVDEFKKMSSIEIDDLTELLYFIKNE